jgi:hypothetical protein
MLKYASKFFFEKILPSVVATVTGAYIVNHYVVGKPADASAPAAVSSAVVPDKAGGSSPEAGVRAKGLSEKAIATAPAEKVQPETAAEKPAEKQTETASLPADTKKHQTARREKAAAKATSTPAAPAPTASLGDDQRDANDLARAAIDRLRSTSDAPRRGEAFRPQSEGSRPEKDAERQPVDPTSARLQEVTRAAVQPAMNPLPPAIQVSAPAVEALRPDAAGREEEPRSNRADRARLPVPPADIPQASQPLDLEANAAAPATRAQTSVADDVLSAAKSVVQAVLPR